ncbi:MAG: hypothetical protein D4R77_11325 [Planctomycetaceae bacterium]|nr:MAG: hypothetical protein D4R77_11325 [Planctomycetaceae bacterium]
MAPAEPLWHIRCQTIEGTEAIFSSLVHTMHRRSERMSMNRVHALTMADPCRCAISAVQLDR